MLGAIIGDIVGSRFEFNPTNDYDFELFTKECGYTDDTICTIAVADALLKGRDFGESLHEWCNRYPCAMGGYGGRFAQWVRSSNPQPYGSFGNGSAMRVSPIGWWFSQPSDVLRESENSAACTHNHFEGIKGAKAVAIAILECRRLRRNSQGKPITQYDIRTKGLGNAISLYTGSKTKDLNINIEEHRNRFDETCQGTVPVALAIILNSTSFEDAIRQAVSLGADADTLGAIVGSIAEALWGIPEWIKQKVLPYLPQEMRAVVSEFHKSLHQPRELTHAFHSSGIPKELMTMIHGQMHTLIDLLKVLNEKDPIKDADDAVRRLADIRQTNLRQGDEAAFLALRTIWCLIARANDTGVQGVDIEKLEQDMINFHNDSGFLKTDSILSILYYYSVTKMIKYIQFTNDFMRYKSYDEIHKALETIGFSHCGENDPGYYYSFSPYAFWQIRYIMKKEWINISDNDTLNNEKFEHVFFGRFESMTKQFGLPETINKAYESYCHNNVKGPRRQEDATIWGPIYRINGSNIEKGCSDSSIENESFEMRFAKRLLENHPAYEMIGRKRRSWVEDTYYVPKEDFTLPVYSEVLGKLKFDSQEEKEKKIRELKDKRGEYAG
jgi:ADP-ribosylglycohydrolase